LIKREDHVIVLLDNSRYDDSTARNIFAYTRTGELLWQIGKSIEKNSFPAFTNIYVENDELWAVNINGYTYQLNWQTGEQLDQKHTK